MFSALYCTDNRLTNYITYSMVGAHWESDKIKADKRFLSVISADVLLSGFRQSEEQLRAKEP